MSRMGRLIQPNGKCYLCGVNLKAGTICFDCMDTNLTKRELSERIFEAQMNVYQKKGNCSIKPEEGIDYIVKHDAIVFLGASGVARVMVEEEEDEGDILSRIDTKHIEWNEIDIEHIELGEQTIKLDMHGNAFDEQTWLREKLTGVKEKDKADKSSGYIRPLHVFQSEPQSANQSEPQSEM